MSDSSTASVKASAVDPVRGLGYRADVDGLRGVAILLVLLFHAGVPWARGGYGGVDAFFVISGYLIGFQVERELGEGSFALLPFYEKRVRRILPALLAVVLFTLALGLVLLDARELRMLAEQAAAATLSMSNVFYWATTSYFSPNSHLQPLLMTWSLGIEVQFYLLLPLLALAVARWSRRAAPGVLLLTLALSLTCATLAMHRGWAAGFYLLSGRWWELAAGAVLGSREVGHGVAQFRRGWPAEVAGCLGVAGIVLSAVIPEPSANLLLPPTVVPVASAVLLCASARSWCNRNLLASRLLSGFGRRSYSVYLWHWPLLSFATVCSAGYLAPRGRVVALGVALLVAELSYRFVEVPFRTTRHKLRTLRVIAGVGAVVLAASASLVALRGIPSLRPAAARVEAATRPETLSDLCLLQGEDGNAQLAAACRPVDATAALLGDSHAAALAPAVVQVQPNTALWMKTSCPPLLGSTVRSTGPDSCSVFMRSTVDAIEANPHIRTVVLAGYWLTAASDPAQGIRFVPTASFAAPVTEEQSWNNLRTGLSQICRSLRMAGKRVVLLEDVPLQRYDPRLLGVAATIPLRGRLGAWLSDAPLSLETEPHPRTEAELRMRAMLAQIGADTGSRVISLYDPLCDGESCHVLAGGLSLYVDRQHLTALGAQRVVSASGLAAALASGAGMPAPGVGEDVQR